MAQNLTPVNLEELKTIKELERANWIWSLQKKLDFEIFGLSGYTANCDGQIIELSLCGGRVKTERLKNKWTN